MNIKLLRPHLPCWVHRHMLRWWSGSLMPTTEVIVTDRRSFTDDDVVLPPGWSKFPIHDGEVRSEW